MRNWVANFKSNKLIVDGMLKDYNSGTGSLSEFSRKGKMKGSKDISILYAYNPETREPIAAKSYAVNMLDQSTTHDFMKEFSINKDLMIPDKGFLSEEFVENAEKKEGLSYFIPLKKDSKLISKYGMDAPSEHPDGFKDRTVLYKKE